MKRLLLVCTLAACARSSSQPAAPAPARDVTAVAAEVTRIADEVVDGWIAAYPNLATIYGQADVPDDGLEDNSLSATAAWQAREDAWAARLAAIDGESLWGRPEWITYGFVRELVDASRQQRVCRYELWPVNQMSGWPYMLMQLAGAQRVGTAELRDKALARWRLVPRYIDNEIANSREGLKAGFSSPRANVDLFIAQLDQLLALAPDQSPFWGPAGRDPALAPAWTALLTGEIYPAIRREREFLKEEYRAAAREALGISANPDGEACYRASFRALTTIDRDPAETYQLGQKTVAANLAEAQALASRVLGVSDLVAIVKRLRNDTSNRFKSRDEELAFAQAAVERARASVGDAFEALPRAGIAVDPYPAFLEPSASDSYEPAPLDGSRPAKYRINLGRYADVTRANTEVTAFHEAYPGHHLQIAISRELPERHRIVSLVGNSAFAEGWARYAEALSEELGLYSSDYGKIQRRLWPARGMVADPGLHLRGWTAKQTADYLRETGRFTDAEVDALIYRIAAWPAQLTAYDTGGLEFRGLRKKAEAALGKRFDLRTFHRVVLENGSVTIPMLRRIVDHWLAQQEE